MTRKVDDGADTPSDRDSVWSSLLPAKSDAVIIQVEQADGDTETAATTPVTPATTPVASVDTPRLGNNRKNTLLSTFHRNLRMSIKAVADSPGHLSRQVLLYFMSCSACRYIVTYNFAKSFIEIKHRKISSMYATSEMKNKLKWNFGRVCSVK